MEVNEHFERLSLTYPYLGLGVQDDFCIQLLLPSFLRCKDGYKLAMRPSLRLESEQGF
uniref:Uncharacterized protein n=1 Tax=Candidatus Kentrum sp. FM TaxID=2126340 RepID=A0A450W8D5_9GAMM|nr:MAG: hypothetical protein BECKFM1743C_GA0114222_101104 [Candidatus Kentron sp. FM]VFK13258.1 MAG: hypothetical protein BECKFM1743B_GA0114221_102731 [Candidatus Kentron sp. FM]